MEKKFHIEALLDLLERRDYHALRAMLQEENEVDIAEAISELPHEKAVVPYAAQRAGGGGVFQSSAGDPAGDHPVRHGPGAFRHCGGAVCGRCGGYAGRTACQRSQAGAEKCRARYPTADQPVSQLPGKLCGQHHDGRVYRSAQEYDGDGSHRSYPAYRSGF